jgi:hypothetical protein
MSTVNKVKSISEYENAFSRCKKYKPSKDRICEFDLVDRFMWCDGCTHFKQPDDCLKMQRQADKDKIANLLLSFPPYHGEGFNYTKQEVEAYLDRVRSFLEAKY